MLSAAYSRIFATGSRDRYSSEDGSLRSVDLLLPKEKLPLDINKYSWRGKKATVKEHFGMGSLKGKSYALGSSSDDELLYRTDLGLFVCVKEAWENHWNLRTSPEDWWFPVACRIAKAIDTAAKSNYKSTSEPVRELFVDHEGKKEIKVDLPVTNIYDIRYEDLFATFSLEIRQNIKVPAFADCMQSDFSSTTPTHKIASEINLMASMQQFFSYETGMCGCGLKSLEMLGTQADWDRLVLKLREVQNILKPIQRALDYTVGEAWFDHVEEVFKKLAKTYANPAGTAELQHFWADILMHGTDYEYGPSGFGKTPVDAYNGWLIKFLTGKEYLWKSNVNSAETREVLNGINSVPMKLSLEIRNPVVSDDADLIGGIAGFLIVRPEKTYNQVPSVQPHHMWAMLLPNNSPLRHP